MILEVMKNHRSHVARVASEAFIEHFWLEDQPEETGEENDEANVDGLCHE
jgi:hypothetical protein